MIVPVMAISNLVLTQQIYSEETKGAHAHNRDRVPLIANLILVAYATLAALLSSPFESLGDQGLKSRTWRPRIGSGYLVFPKQRW